MRESDALASVFWEKSPESAETGECVEVAITRSEASIRTSRFPAAGHLTVGAVAWARLTARIGDLRVAR